MLGGVRSGAALAVVAPRLPFPRARGGEGRGAGTRSSGAARQTHFVGQRGDWPAVSIAIPVATIEIGRDYVSNHREISEGTRIDSSSNSIP